MTLRGLLLLLAGAAIAFIGALCGIGGGLFAVPMLHYLFKLDLRASVATALCLVAATAYSSTLTEVLREDSALELMVVGPLAVGRSSGRSSGSSSPSAWMSVASSLSSPWSWSSQALGWCCRRASLPWPTGLRVGLAQRTW